MSSQNPDLPEGGKTTFSSADDYAAFVARDGFAAQANDIFATIRQAVDQGQPLSEGYRRATESYINQEDNEQLRALADVLLTAPAAAAAQQRLNQIKLQMERSGVTEQLDSEERRLKYQSVRYNHGLRDLIARNPDTFTRSDLQNWLEKASGGNSLWARQLISGVAAEVAVARTIARASVVTGVQFADITQDMRGVDLVVQLRKGGLINVDVKSGGNQPLGGTEYRRGRLEIGIGAEGVEEFDIKPEYQPGLINGFEQAVSRD